ncbi:MAG TPA: hypothetical protein VEZ42_00080 [Pseudonocardia sp.]|nr:hypothetical protein [Pseudonocardia sp.]
MDGSASPPRWPAYGVAVLFLGYAAGKAAFAMQGRLGFPSGPVVSAADTERYAREVMDAATGQWLATASGVLGACIAVATVTALGRRTPRTVMLLVLVGMLLAAGAGAATMIVDGFGGPGPGWQWYHGVLGIAVIGLLLAMIRSYAGAPGRVAA